MSTRAPRSSEMEPLQSALLSPAPAQRPQRGRRVAGAEKISKDLVATRVKLQSENCEGKKCSREISAQTLFLLRSRPTHVSADVRSRRENLGRWEVVGRRSQPMELARRIRRSCFPLRQRTAEHLLLQKKGERAGGKVLRKCLWPTSAVFFISKAASGGGTFCAPPCVGHLKWERELIFKVRGLSYSLRRRLARRGEGSCWNTAPNGFVSRATSESKTAPSLAEGRNPLSTPPPWVCLVLFSLSLAAPFSTPLLSLDQTERPTGLKTF